MQNQNDFFEQTLVQFASSRQYLIKLSDKWDCVASSQARARVRHGMTKYRK